MCKIVMRKCEGYTLIQLLIVLALSALLACISIPVFSFFDKLPVRIELDRLYELCMLLQQKAQLENKEYGIVFDLKNHTYSALDKQYALSKSLKFSILPGVKGPPAQPYKLLTHPITFPQNSVIFHPSGVINSGSIYLVDQSSNTLYALTVSISPFSYIRRYSYGAMGWLPL